MGMFDYVRCDVPLPDGWEADELQTKDLECQMTTAWITAEGRLLVEDFEYEPVPEDELPYKDHPSPIMRFVGCLQKTNRRWRDLNYHGMLEFYGIEQPETARGRVVRYVDGNVIDHETGEVLGPAISHDYTAKFTDGKLVEITGDARPIGVRTTGC